MHAERACGRAVGPLVIGRCFAMCGTVRRLVRRSMPDGRERSANKNFNLPNTDESAAECKHDSLAPKSAQSNALPLERSVIRAAQSATLV